MGEGERELGTVEVDERGGVLTVLPLAADFTLAGEIGFRGVALVGLGAIAGLGVACCVTTGAEGGGMGVAGFEEGT